MDLSLRQEYSADWVAGFSPRLPRAHIERSIRAWVAVASWLISWDGFAAPCSIQPQNEPPEKTEWHVPPSASQYDRRTYLIAMRDGVKLNTTVLIPKVSHQPLPFILIRSPYGTQEPTQYLSESFLKAGYLFVVQDVRGRFGSEGRFRQMSPLMDAKRRPGDVDESTDTYDTIAWLLKNVRPNNGKVGLWGASYTGFYAATGMINAHPAIKAVSPQAPPTDWFVGDDLHHNGALMLVASFSLMEAMALGKEPLPVSANGLKYGDADAYTFYLGLGPLANADANYFHGHVPDWSDVMEHGTYDDFWRSRNLLPHLRDIRPAVLDVGGWYDAEDLYGALHLYDAISRDSPTAPLTLVMGPWTHVQWWGQDGSSVDALQFGSKTAEYFRGEVELPFFDAYLKHDRKPALPRVMAFETGTNRWHRLNVWPPPGPERSIYLREGGKLSFETPPQDSLTSFDEYTSDPAHPVPYVDQPSSYLYSSYTAHDQSFASKRSDVLVYTSDVLKKDLTIAGPVSTDVFFASSGTDSDVIVKLIDVHPQESDSAKSCGAPSLSGYQEMVRGDVMRAKFRKSLEHPAPLVPDEVTPIDFKMSDAFHTFKAGHRIMVQIQSSWFPLVDRNPQKFVDIYHATAADFQIARERVYRSARQPSRVVVHIVE